MTSEAAIVAREVTKRYGQVTALEAFSLEIARGEVFCLLGPNGSGKTTFLRALTGFLTPSSGSISVAGYDTVREPMAARRRIGYLPESVPLYRNMRVGEFLAFMARLRGVASVETAVRNAAAMLSLEDRLRSPIAALSRGYRQRVALAQALVHDPEVLVLDEPTNGLDPRQIIETRNLIRGLAGRRTVLMSSHILAEVEKTADRVAVLLGGRLRGVRTTAGTPDLESWFLSLA
jgi:ABC-2 type transport system ATP-binding protein